MTKLHTIDPDEFKTTSIISNGCNRPPHTGEIATAPLNASVHGANLQSSDQLVHKAGHRRWRRQSREQDKTLRPCQLVKMNTTTLIEFKLHSYKSIERDHQPKHLQWTEWSYPRMPHIENQGEVRRFPSQHSYDYISPNWAKCTYLSLRVHLQL